MTRWRIPIRWLPLSVAAASAVLLRLASAEQNRDACQAPGWDTHAELALFGGEAAGTGAGGSVDTAPMLELNRLYNLKLYLAGEVRFAQDPPKAKVAEGSRGGVIRFAVPARGIYRITVDVPVWIDVVSATDGVVNPLDFRGWHACENFRKSLQYALNSQQTVTLQISGAQVDGIKIVIRAL